MSKRFLIAYDLKNPEQDYTNLYNLIKSCGEWKHPLESVWVVVSQEITEVEDLYKKIHCAMSDNELLFIVDITESKCTGWLPKSFWPWLKER